MIRVVLIAPQIPQNTGSVGRLCAGQNLPLHLVRPLGFELSDRYLKRAGLDYWPHIRLAVHDSLDEVLELQGAGRPWFFTARGPDTGGVPSSPHWDVRFGPDDLLVFGREADGLPAHVKQRYDSSLVRIPHNGNIRSLNLATAVAVAVYEALRQQREGGRA